MGSISNLREIQWNLMKITWKLMNIMWNPLNITCLVPSLAPPAGREILLLRCENQYFQCPWRLRLAGKSWYFFVKINIFIVLTDTPMAMHILMHKNTNIAKGVPKKKHYTTLVPTPHPGQLITVAVLSSGFLPGTLTATYGVSPVTVWKICGASFGIRKLIPASG